MFDFFSGNSGWVNRDPSDDYWYTARGAETSAGVEITESNASEMPAVWSCVGKNAKTLSSLPVHVYEKTGEKTRKPVDHPLNDILDWKGNKNATGTMVRATQVANRLLWGNSVSEIVYAQDGKTVTEIIPLQSRWLRPKIGDGGKYDGELLWEHWPENHYDTTLTPDKYLHEPGHFSLNGILGISAVTYCREAIAAGRAAEIFGATFFGNGAQPGGFLEFPADIQLSDERQDQLVEKFNETWQGSKRAHKIGRLREGVKFTQVGMPLEDMQFLGLRKFNRIEICMIFDTPPVMIQELDPGKYTAIEQAMIAWVRDSLLPQTEATEAAFKRRFFPDSNLYLKFNLAGLARGDMAARSAFYREGISWGWFTQNDVREMEDMDPIEGGDTNWIGSNMMPLAMGGTLVQQKAQQNGGGGGGNQDDDDQDDQEDREESRRRPQSVIVVPVNVIGQSRETPAIDLEAIGRQVAESVAAAVDRKPLDASAVFEPMLSDAAARITTKEEKAVRAALKRYHDDEAAYLAWCDVFFTGHVEYVTGTIEPIVRGIERATCHTPDERPADFAARYSQHQLGIARTIPQGGTDLDAGYLLAILKAAYLNMEKSHAA